MLPKVLSDDTMFVDFITKLGSKNKNKVSLEETGVWVPRMVKL
jgi:hypothetical protein